RKSVTHRGTGQLQQSLERASQFQDKKERSRDRKCTHDKNTDDRRIRWGKEPKAGEQHGFPVARRAASVSDPAPEEAAELGIGSSAACRFWARAFEPPRRSLCRP